MLCQFRVMGQQLHPLRYILHCQIENVTVCVLSQKPQLHSCPDGVVVIPDWQGVQLAAAFPTGFNGLFNGVYHDRPVFLVKAIQQMELLARVLLPRDAQRFKILVVQTQGLHIAAVIFDDSRPAHKAVEQKRCLRRGGKKVLRALNIVGKALAVAAVQRTGSQNLFKFLHRHRLCKIVALHMGAAHAFEVIRLCLCLHALGNHGQLEPVSHADDRCEDIAAPRVVHALFKELHVQLQCLNRHVLQRVE